MQPCLHRNVDGLPCPLVRTWKGLSMQSNSRTALILLEGLPGSGKSTLAHFLIRRLTEQGIAAKWWYEEEIGHPLYIFHDAASMQQVLDNLAAGNYRQVITAALAKWRQLSQALQTSDTVVILDSCLFGYLTWTLFPYDAPQQDIHAYLAEVARIIHDNDPCLVYLYQDDVTAALRKICARRGGGTADRLIRNATESAYGKHHGLQGFSGMASLWRDYRAVTDDAFARITIPKLAIENSAGDWVSYQRTVLQFLGLPDAAFIDSPVQHANRFAGEYYAQMDDAEASCIVLCENGELLLDRLPLVWPRNRLVPIAQNAFAVESLPFTVLFEEDAPGEVVRMIVTGSALFSGTVDNIFRKKEKRMKTSLG